jgi:hypothetical protein
MIDVKLKEYATDRQAEYIDAVNKHGSNTRAAKALGIGRRAVDTGILSVKKKAASSGYAPDNDFTNPTAPGFGIKRVSTNYNEDGQINQQWVIQEQNKENQQEAFKEYMAGFLEDVKGKAKKTVKPKLKHDKDLMSMIVIGDAHVGMYAWHEETGKTDFDTNIACRDMRAAIDDLVERSPNAETGVLVDVGDFMHANTSDNATAKGTALDVDTRFPRILRAAGMVMRYCIDKMLTKYKNVVVIIAKGNHNPEPAVAVALMLNFYYDKEPRVDVKDTIGMFHYLEWGRHLIGVNHGDKIKPARLVSVMARDQAEAWGRTRFRRWITGHIHHERVIEHDGCTVESFNTLAPPDAWHSGAGYGASQSMSLITLHKTKGRHSRHIYDLPEGE